MLLTRFWYVVLAAVAAVSIASMMIVRSTYEHDRGQDSEVLLRGDRTQIDSFLRTEARVRLDNLVPVASQPELTRMMGQATARTSDTALRDLAPRISQQLRTLNAGMGGEAAGQMMLAMDARGYVVGRTGLGENSGIGDYLGGVPLIARALDGYVRDDTWELQGRVFRMSARPVISQGRYVGAVVHAREIDDAFVRRLSEALGGPSIAFFGSTGIYASNPGVTEGRAAPPPPPVLAEQIQGLAHNSSWRTRGFTDVLTVHNGAGVAVYGTLAGTVGLNGGGFAVGRARPAIPADYLLHAPSDEVRKVPWSKIIALLLGSTVLGLLFVYLEHDRGSTHLRAMLNDLAERKVERLDPMELRGTARKTALAINEAFERAMREELSRAGAKPRRSVEDLDSLLGPANGDSAQPFADIPPPPPPSLGGAPAPPPPRAAPPPAPPPRAMTPPAGMPPPPPRAMTPPAGTPAAAPTAPTPARSPAPSTLVGGTAAPTAPPAPSPAPAAAGPADVSSPSPAVAVGGIFADAAEEQAHWREVFDQFIALKKQCNEEVSTLIFEKFSATLQKNKDQLVQRTGARAVRFQVYIKDNKATLKASPVK